MRLFDFDRDAAHHWFVQQGWVHLHDAVTAEFLGQVRADIAAVMQDAEVVGGNRANKDQFRYELAEPQAAQQELFDVICAVTSLSSESIVLSERHVNAYHQRADDDPVPHKDRFASAISVGLSIDVAPESSLVLYPYDDRSLNTCDSAADYFAGLEPEQRPPAVLLDARPVEIFDRPGDVVIFAGSSTWHCRRRARGTTNLFFKFNDFGADPLSEDVRSSQRGTTRVAVS